MAERSADRERRLQATISKMGVAQKKVEHIYHGACSEKYAITSGSQVCVMWPWLWLSLLARAVQVEQDLGAPGASYSVLVWSLARKFRKTIFLVLYIQAHRRFVFRMSECVGRFPHGVLVVAHTHVCGHCHWCCRYSNVKLPTMSFSGSYLTPGKAPAMLSPTMKNE